MDGTGDAYLTGLTSSTNFPTMNPLQPTCNGGNNCATYGDAFVTEMNPSGAALVYSTYLGGSSYDGGTGIVVDSLGNAYITGFTQSTNFPTMNPFEPSNAGSDDAFVTKIGQSGPYGVVSPTTVNFGDVQVGQTSPQQRITLKNTGNAELKITDISISGNFALPVNKCASGVKPGTHCNVYVTFTPHAVGTETGTLTFTDNVGTARKRFHLLARAPMRPQPHSRLLRIRPLMEKR